MNRRTFSITSLSALAATAYGVEPKKVRIATQYYPWFTFYRRSGKEWTDEDGLKAVAESGITSYEPIGKDAAHIESLAPLLKANGLEMRSIYVNSTLHDAAQASESIESVLQIARAAKPVGAEIIVTNPSPIKWGGEELKTDDQLAEQAANLDALGKALREELGLQLAYHNHDIELRAGAREFHHMLTATDPANVKFCLDAHWVYRGCGNSEIAVFDALEHYHERIVELHLRQSTDHIWGEVFTMAGDIDYTRLFEKLAGWNIRPHLVIEQSIEKESPETMTAVEAHARSLENLEKS